MKATTKNFPTVHRRTLHDFKKGCRGGNRLQYRLQGWIEDYQTEKWPDADRWNVVEGCMEMLSKWLPHLHEYELVAGDKKLFKSLVVALVNDVAKNDLGIKHKPFDFSKFNRERYLEVKNDLVEGKGDRE